MYAVAEDPADPFVAPLVEAASQRNVTILMGATTHKGNFPGDVYNSVLVITPDGLDRHVQQDARRRLRLWRR